MCVWERIFSVLFCPFLPLWTLFSCSKTIFVFAISRTDKRRWRRRSYYQYLYIANHGNDTTERQASTSQEQQQKCTEEIKLDFLVFPVICFHFFVLLCMCECVFIVHLWYHRIRNATWNIAYSSQHMYYFVWAKSNLCVCVCDDTSGFFLLLVNFSVWSHIHILFLCCWYIQFSACR